MPLKDIMKTVTKEKTIAKVLTKALAKAMATTICSCLLLLPLSNTFAKNANDNPAEKFLEQQPSTQSLECGDPVIAGREAVKETVGPLYANGADQPQLQTAANQVDRLITDATYCRIALQSGPEPKNHDTIGEWSSLHQWLNRLADMLLRSASEAGHVGWRDEYTLFAEIYEFEP